MLDINTAEVCEKLQKLKSITKAEYVELKDNYEYIGRYVLFISKHLTRLANQYNVNWSDVALRYRVIHSIENILNMYYDNDDNYSLDLREDYNGKWYVEILNKDNMK